ncbi:methyltransferase [Agaribacter flavus]|uniref:Ribosomal RNA small subunit methyltransferase C n=1 Tax=Agaribacter flavus TaxID=1902781 RepID=A0ABV7FPN8_9ALTE
MLSSPSQLIKRNLDVFSSGKWALLNPEDTAVFSLLPDETLGLHHFYHVFRACREVKPDQHLFSAYFTEETLSTLNGVVIYMPKAKQVLDMLLDNLANYLPIDAKVLVVGENKSGVKSADKIMQKYLADVQKLDGAKHCTLLIGNLKQKDALTGFSIDKYLLKKSYSINGQALMLCSLPGVFGHKELDPGTKLLLDQFPDAKEIRQMRGKLYDFACGTGIIGAYFKCINPKLTLCLSDVSALSIYCTQQTLAENKIEGDLIASDGMQEVQGKFDYIVSNPPFHSGLKNDYEITQQFIQDAYRHCLKQGKLSLVANRFLPYADCIQQTFNQFTVLAKSTKFTVYQTTKR